MLKELKERLLLRPIFSLIFLPPLLVFLGYAAVENLRFAEFSSISS
jgi:hypothetical protein